MKKSYAKCENGLIHLVSISTGGEYTICGDSFEGHCMDDNSIDFKWEFVKNGPVTCPRCAQEIKNCRGVMIDLRKNND